MKSKKIAVYPGSFNPLHKGHWDIIFKAAHMFDEIIVAKGWNPTKLETAEDLDLGALSYVKPMYYKGLLKDFINSLPIKPDAIIKGLRNAQDFEYEKIQQYWNEDLGIDIPTVYIIADRNLTHISSSAIKAVDKFKKDNK